MNLSTTHTSHVDGLYSNDLIGVYLIAWWNVHEQVGHGCDRAEPSPVGRHQQAPATSPDHRGLPAVGRSAAGRAVRAVGRSAERRRKEARPLGRHRGGQGATPDARRGLRGRRHRLEPDDGSDGRGQRAHQDQVHRADRPEQLPAELGRFFFEAVRTVRFAALFF
uniref:(northern house mosquito) hypothetical protein n=1 Tax=Culex pipiens TaxID=7175 RepID=A0A8D8D7E7_CULPI